MRFDTGAKGKPLERSPDFAWAPPRSSRRHRTSAPGIAPVLDLPASGRARRYGSLLRSIATEPGSATAMPPSADGEVLAAPPGRWRCCLPRAGVPYRSYGEARHGRQARRHRVSPREGRSFSQARGKGPARPAYGRRAVAETRRGTRRQGRRSGGKTPARSLRSRANRGKTVRWIDPNEWMAAKLVGLFGLIVLALVVLYLLVTLG